MHSLHHQIADRGTRSPTPGKAEAVTERKATMERQGWNATLSKKGLLGEQNGRCSIVDRMMMVHCVFCQQLPLPVPAENFSYKMIVPESVYVMQSTYYSS